MSKRKEIVKSIIIFIGYIVLSLYLSLLMQKYINSNNFWIANLSGILTIFIIDLLIVIIFKSEFKNSFIDFKKNYKDYLKLAIKYWLYGLVIMIISNNLIVKLTNGMATNEEQVRDLIKAMPLYSGVVMCLLGPISEESMFRLNFRKCFNNEYFFAVFSGLIFGLAHVMNYDISQYWFIIPYGILGYYFAKAYYETNNIFTSISMHIFHNTLTILILLLSWRILP